MASPPGSVLSIDITQRLTPTFDGRSFGDVGTYACLIGTVTGRLDPAHPANAGIVNLDKAPREADGTVAYRTDLTILTPSRADRGNGWLLYDVVNRGNKLAMTRLNHGADGNDLITAADAGDGLLMRRPDDRELPDRPRPGWADHADQPR